MGNGEFSSPMLQNETQRDPFAAVRKSLPDSAFCRVIRILQTDPFSIGLILNELQGAVTGREHYPLRKNRSSSMGRKPLKIIALFTL